MSNPSSIDLQKKADQVGITLAKKGISKVPTCQVKAALDVSGSMDHAYRSGNVQRAFEQLLGFAFKFDDDGSIDMYAFDSRGIRLKTATEEGYKTYIKEHVQHLVGGSTNYGPVLQMITEDSVGKPSGGGFFSKPKPAPGGAPTVALFFTDGECYDGDAADRVIREAEKNNSPIYYHLIGVGGASFRTLERLADAYDNCGFAQIRDISMSDEDMYKLLITDEFVAYLKKHGAQ